MQMEFIVSKFIKSYEQQNGVVIPLIDNKNMNGNINLNVNEHAENCLASVQIS